MPDARAPTRARRKAREINVNELFCSGCGICIQFCPHKVLEHSKEINAGDLDPAVVVNLEACTVCRLCELYCGSFAIAVEERDNG